MRAAEVYLETEFGARLPFVVDGLEVDEKVHKSSVFTVSGWTPIESGSDESFWRGSTLVVKSGVTPWLTTRTTVVDAPGEREYKNGRLFWRLKLKCLGARAQRTVEDRVWTMRTLPEIVMTIAASYSLVPRIEATGPALAIRKTIHQRVDDWSFLKDCADRLDADLFVVNRTLYVRARSKSNVGPSIRTYVVGVHPVVFTVEASQSGRVGARATNRKSLTYQERINLAAEAKALVEDPGLGTQSLFNPNDVGGVAIVPVPSDPATQASFMGKTGQFDAGAPVPSTETDPVFAANKAKAKRRSGRDRVTKAALDYAEWDVSGIPMVGTKILVYGLDAAANGEYFVRGRVLRTLPTIHVRLTLSRHSTTVRSRSSKLTPEQIAQIAAQAQAIVEGQVEKVPQPPDVAAMEGLGLGADFGTGVPL